MQTGWLKDSNTWYSLADSGAMRTGWYKEGNTWYSLASSGAMRTGWLSYKGSDYFLTKDGSMAVGLAQTRLDGACSIFGEDGKLLVGKLVVEQDADGIVKLVESK